ncbi:capsid protein [robinz virus RP_258]|nr:capsid protein [robinz virus RP_258]
MPRFRRRTRRSRRRGGFTRRVKRIILRSHEPKKYQTAISDTLREGNATSREISIINLPSLLTQGVQDDQFIGNAVWLKGIKMIGTVNLVPANAAYAHIDLRYTLYRSRINAALGASGSLYSSTTTTSTNPAQTSPAANVPVFANTSAQQFYGDGYTQEFDTTTGKVISSKTLRINPGGASASVARIKMWFPIGKKHQYIDPVETDLSSAPNHGKWGSYYIVGQCIATAAGIASTTLVNATILHTLYFKDI